MHVSTSPTTDGAVVNWLPPTVEDLCTITHIVFSFQPTTFNDIIVSVDPEVNNITTTFTGFSSNSVIKYNARWKLENGNAETASDWVTFTTGK